MTTTARAARWVIATGAGALVALVFVYLAWPGYMSYDSVFALEQARAGIVSGTYPPLVSYLWWVLECFVPGQGGMLAFQVVMLMAGIGFCVHRISDSVAAAIMACAAVPFLPALAGPMLVVWKDILFAAFVVAATCASFVICQASKRPRPFHLIAAGLLLLLAASTRLNGLPALVPAMFFLVKATFRSGQRAALVAGVAAGLVLLAACVIAISTWRLPDFQAIEKSRTQTYVMFHDLLGISNCMGVQVFSQDMTGGREYDRRALKSIYHPEHVQRSFSGGGFALSEASLAHVTQREWLAEIAHHPACYIDHKLNVLRYMLGYNRGQVFYITDAGVFQNELGLDAPRQQRVAPIVDRVLAGSASVFARPIAYLVYGLLGLVILWRKGADMRLPLALMASSILYLGPAVMLFSGADLRYQFPEVVEWFIVGSAGIGALLRSGAGGVRRDDGPADGLPT